MASGQHLSPACLTLVAIIDRYNEASTRERAAELLREYDAHRDQCRICKPRRSA